MKNFRVKLIEGHKATKKENVKGYLGDADGLMDLPIRYTRNDAIKKAKTFGGKIEKVKPTAPIVEMKLAQVVKANLLPIIRHCLDKKIAEFIDSNETIGDRMFIADVFANIYKENKSIFDSEALNQLEELTNEMYSFDYVLIV